MNYRFRHLHFPVYGRSKVKPLRMELGGTVCWTEAEDMVTATMVILNPADQRRPTTELDRLVTALRRFNVEMDGVPVGDLTADGHVLRVAEDSAKALQRKQNEARVQVDCSRAEGRRRALERYKAGHTWTGLRSAFLEALKNGTLPYRLAEQLKLDRAAQRRTWDLK